MKALSKQKLIKLIQNHFQEDEIILQDDVLLKLIWESFGDDYFIEGNQWVLTKKNENW